ncbi:MAG TPA: cysteine desulfurase family protein [Thermoanaerobaculia bacterium]|nr:cysteine desulfurase family protein [Thermoanaerobaculia bacterium]
MPALRTVYADHHATTPLRPEALEAMRPWLAGLAANASSLHAPGRAARAAVEGARERIATLLGVRSEELVFTSGGTESDALAVCGGARAARDGEPLRTRVAYSAAEHAAVREAARSLRREGFEPLELPVDGAGLPRQDGLAAANDGRTALLSLILAGNETGARNGAIAASAAAARAAGALVHTDAVQAVGKVPVRPSELGVDLLSFTGHKLGGPKGAGVLWVRRGVRLSPLFTGGGQERGRRGGTENVAAIAGLAAALETALSRLEEEGRRLAVLRDSFEEGLRERVPGVRVNGLGPAGRLPTASSVTFEGIDGETLLVALDLEGVAASSGSACSSGTPAPSRVLLACGLPEAEVRSTLRFSFGWTTTEEEVERLLEVLPRLVARVRAA